MAARLAPTLPASGEPDDAFLAALSRLAYLDAEMHRLRTERPAGWANMLGVYSAEAQELRQSMGLEYKRDDRGRVFLVRGDSALYHLAA